MSGVKCTHRDVPELKVLAEKVNGSEPYISLSQGEEKVCSTCKV